MCAAPEDDRRKLVEFFQTKYPDVKIASFTLGALAFSPDAKAQYDSVMEFPPFASEIEQGERLWMTPFSNGKTYADCLPNAGKMIAGMFPMFDEKAGRVITFETLLNACRVANGEAPYPHGDMATMGRLSAYARTFSDGMKMNVKVEGAGALKAYEDGRNTYYRRHGQLNLSCAGCHVDAAGYRMRSEIVSPVLGQATHWPVFRGGTRLMTLQARYADCFERIRHVPDAQGSERFNNLEYFHSYLSNGMELKSSVFRK